MYSSVKKVVASEDYILSIGFDNGERGTLDLTTPEFWYFSKA